MDNQTVFAEPTLVPRVSQALVVSVNREQVKLALPDGEREAQMALAFPYAPKAGDVVLTLTQDNDCYIVGVLQGRGRTLLETPGDLTIRAGGRVSITGSELALQAPKITLKADRFETTVRVLAERCLSAYRWVKETLHLNAGRTRTVVQDEAVLRAGRIRETARQDVVINGEQVKLG